MEPQHKKFILENIDAKTAAQIAEDLGLKERKVKKFLEKQKSKAGLNAPHAQTASSLKPQKLMLSILLIIFLGIAAFGNSVNGVFIWDDTALIEENEYITSAIYLPQVFTEDIGAASGNKFHFYRPLQIVTYMVDHALWGMDVKGYHFTSIAIHIGVALAIYFLITALFGDNLIALLAAGFFVVHPVHVEAVTYLSGRADPLALLLLLLTFLFYLRPGALNYGLMLLSYALALLSRENSLILPVLLLLSHFSLGKRIEGKKFLSVLGLAGVYVLLRVTLLKGLLAGSIPTTTLIERLPGFFVAVATYFRLLFLPFDLHMEYGSGLFSFTDVKAILGIVMVTGLLGYAFKKRKEDRLIFFGTLWFFIALLPVSNIYPINAYMSEHWLYLPSVGFFLVLARFLRPLYRGGNLKIFAMVFVAGLLSFYTFLTARQNIVWAEPITFFERTLEYAPESWKAHYNLANEYKDINSNKNAVASYKEAIALKPDYANSYNNLGIVYKNMERYAEAAEVCAKAVELEPDLATAHNNLGIAYAKLGRQEEAVASFEKATALDPRSEEALFNLGNVYAAAGRLEEAVASYKKVVAVNPRDVAAHFRMGNAYISMKKRTEAAEQFKKVVKLRPDYADAYNNLAAIYFETKQYGRAIEYCDKARNLGYTNRALLEALEPYR